METAKAVKNRSELLRFLQKELILAGIEEANGEAEQILEETLGITKVELYIEPEKGISFQDEERSLKIVSGRKKRIPLAYLLGKADFWKETLIINESCLVPRPETEFLVESVIKSFQDKDRKFSFLDIGTGSGAIAVALLREFPNASGTLLDASEKALDVARANVAKYKIHDRAVLKKGDLFAVFSAENKWDLIISNPPYLSEQDLLNTQPELNAEPRAALDGGKDGLDFYRRIIPEAKKHLNPSGILALEVGIGQAGTVSTWLQDAGYDNIQRFQDYLHIDRVILAKLKT